MRIKLYAACATILLPFIANAADPVVAPVPPAAPSAPATIKPVAAPAAQPAVKAPAQPAVQKPNVAAPAPFKAAQPNAVAKPNAPQAPASPTTKAPAAKTANGYDAAAVRELNKKYLLDFVRAATAGDVKPFYKANPQFAGSITEAQFVNKFGKYTELPNDIAALEASDFSATEVKTINNNKRYKGCLLIEAKSDIKLQVVQDSHHYKLTNRYCFRNEEYKLVSFKLGYEE